MASYQKMCFTRNEPSIWAQHRIVTSPVWAAKTVMCGSSTLRGVTMSGVTYQLVCRVICSAIVLGLTLRFLIVILAMSFVLHLIKIRGKCCKYPCGHVLIIAYFKIKGKLCILYKMSKKYNEKLFKHISYLFSTF